MRYSMPLGGGLKQSLAKQCKASESVLARQLFNEALDPATLDGPNLNLPSKGSTMHGSGRPSFSLDSLDSLDLPRTQVQSMRLVLEGEGLQQRP